MSNRLNEQGDEKRQTVAAYHFSPFIDELVLMTLEGPIHP